MALPFGDFTGSHHVISVGYADQVRFAVQLKFEIYPQYYHDSSFRLLAHTLGHHYEYIIGKTDNSTDLHPQKENVFVDVNSFKKAIDKILLKYKLLFDQP